MSEDVLKKIENSMPSLSLKQKKIALAIIQDPLSCSFLSVKELSEKINVSPATIVRFAQTITGEGFPELQQMLHNHIRTESNPIKRMKLKVDEHSKEDEQLAKMYSTQLENMQKTFNGDMIRGVTEAYELISTAERIFTFGTRGSFSVAYFLGQHMNRAFGNVDVVSDDDKIADYLHRAEKDNVAVFVCVPRYSTRLFAAARLLKEKGVKIITINDSTDSPFVPYSDVTFFAPCTSNDFHNSCMAPMLVAELLISFTIARKSETTIESLNDYEKYFDELDQFVLKNNNLS